MDLKNIIIVVLCVILVYTFVNKNNNGLVYKNGTLYVKNIEIENDAKIKRNINIEGLLGCTGDMSTAGNLFVTGNTMNEGSLLLRDKLYANKGIYTKGKYEMNDKYPTWIGENINVDKGNLLLYGNLNVNGFITNNKKE